jgi:hypothetical protein
MHPRALALLIVLLLVPTTPGRSRAEEGMWTFDNPPTALIRRAHGFAPDAKWLESVRLASVRFNDGGSGGFVSSRGLVLTNHHVAAGQLQKMSSEKKDYLKDGFYAKTQAEEVKCVDLVLNVLVSEEDVTARVLAAAKKAKTPELAVKARKAEQARIEKESQDKTKLFSQVVSLYHGGEYRLYRYRKYKDVRLVMAPEKQIAFFGGDSDNFTYPRWDLDMAFFRVYENGKPLSTPNHFRVNPRAGRPGELVFVTGHPGNTERLSTLAELVASRDHLLPSVIEQRRLLLSALRAYSKESAEKERRAKTKVFGLENAVKALSGMLAGLRDPALLAKKQADEAALLEKLDAHPDQKKAVRAAEERIARAFASGQARLLRQIYQNLYSSTLGRIAISIVKLVHEISRPDAERLDGYHDSELEELKYYLFSPAPIYADLETVVLRTSFALAEKKLGGKDPFVQAFREGGKAEEVAARLVGGTKLASVEERKSLVAGGAAAIDKSGDPLVQFARKVEPILRANELWRKKNHDAVVVPAHEEIARARFTALGKSEYPDATFTLRMSFGRIEGYPMNGTQAPPFTTLYGLFDRSMSFGQRGDFALPARYPARRARLDLATPANFVCTCDITGGNSGSPVINRERELVGVIFDGNIESLAGAYLYEGRANRAVALHAAFVVEALSKLYDAGPLADEITGGKAGR